MNKILRLLTTFGAFAMFTAIGTGCLKDSLVEQGLTGPEIYKSPKVVELMGTVAGTNSYQSTSVVAFDIGAKDTSAVLVAVRLAADEPATEDIKVTLDTAGAYKAIIQPYNDSNATHYTPVPAGRFTLGPADLVVTIPKGQREGHLMIRVIPNNLVGGEYALGFRIKSVSNPEVKISGNFNNLFVVVGVKNQYDGVYEMTGTLVDRVVATITGRYPEEIHLITTGANSVAMYYPVYHEYYHPINSGGSLSVYGLYSPVFNFDPTGNGKVLSVVNYYGQPASNGRSARLDDSGINQMNMTTKEMKVKYFLVAGTAVRTEFNETFRYKGPR